MEWLLEAKHFMPWNFHVVRDNAGVLAAMAAAEPEFVAKHAARIQVQAAHAERSARAAEYALPEESIGVSEQKQGPSVSM